MIEKTTTQFLAEHPSMKYVFFGGKGGNIKKTMKFLKGFHEVPLPKIKIDSELVAEDALRNYPEKFKQVKKKITKNDLVKILEGLNG